MNQSEPEPLPQPSPASASPPRTRGGALAVLALLFAIGAGAACAWTWRMLEQQSGRVEALERDLAERPTAASLARIDDLARRVQASEAALAALDQRAGALDQAQRALQQATAQLGGTDRQLGEAEYLERLAAQSLLMGREVRGAIALLAAADELLRAHDDPALHEARAQLAHDLAALREVADFDIEGTWLRLAALEGAVVNLAPSERARANPAEQAQAAPEPDGWSARAEALLERYVTIRRDAPPVKPLLSAAEDEMLRLDIRLALQQAKLAVLAGDQAVYAGALADCDQRVRAQFGTSASANRSFLDELARLAALKVAPELPDVSASLRTLREARAHMQAPG